jgi:hypothetical protein
MFHTNPENTKIVILLAQYLAATSINMEVISYDTLNRIAGVDLRHRRDLLYRAWEMAEKQCGCIFTAVRGIGIKRLPVNETSHVGSHSITGTRRRTKRAIGRISRTNSNEMSGDARQNTALKLAHLNLIHGIADNRRTSTFVTPAVADPHAAAKALKEI